VSISLRGPKLQALFALLVLRPEHPHTRDALGDQLWPDAAPTRVRRAVSDLLYRLRQALGDDWLTTDGDFIRLRADTKLWVDVWAFEQLAARNDFDHALAATKLYGGELLPELFDDWVVARRAALHECLIDCLLQVGKGAEASDNIELALLAYQRVVQADPLDEGATRGLMRAYARRGRYRQALQQYTRLCQQLRVDLDSAPLPETSALAAALHDELSPAPTPSAARPLIGRGHERAVLMRQVELAAQGYGSLVYLEGEPGIGKTRLLESLAEGAAWRGLRVSWGRAKEHEPQSTFAPLDQALQTAAGPALSHLRTHLSPVAAAALTSLIPHVRPAAPLQLTTLPDVVAALQSCLQALTDDSPQLLILDDVQWAGSEFWALVVALGQPRAFPMLVVLAYRPAEVRTNEYVWRSLCALERAASPLRVVLGGLEPADCAALATELGYTLNADTAQMLHGVARGNPLHIGELLAAPDAEGDSLLATLIQRRLTALGPRERTALDVAAVLGREFSLEHWQAVGGAAVLAALPVLVEARFLERANGMCRFQHDLIREQIYAALNPGRRRELHAQTLAAFERQASAALCAWHAQQAALWPQAARWCRLAGEHAQASYAYSAASQLFDQALACADRAALEAGELLAICCGRLRVLAFTGPLPALRAEIDRVEQLATATGSNAARLEALEARVAVDSLDSQPAQLQETIAAALALAEATGDRPAAARLHRVYGLHLLLTAGGHPDKALPYLEQAVMLAEAALDYQALVAALCALGFGQRLLGRSAAAHASASRALALAEVRPELYPARADALRVLAEVALNRSEWELARATLLNAIRLLEELQDRWPLAFAYFMATSICYAMGQHADARTFAGRLQALVSAGGVEADSRWMLYVHTCAIDAAVQAGDLAAAEQIAREVHSLVDDSDDAQAALYLLTALGSLRLYQNRHREALGYLGRAVDLWRQAPSGVLTPMLLHATAAQLLGHHADAEASLRLAEQGLAGSDIAYYNVALYFTRYLVRGATPDLRAAHGEIQRQAALFRDPNLRAAFLHEVRLHRIIERLWQMRSLASTFRAGAGIWAQLTALYRPEVAPQPRAPRAVLTIDVQLARAEAPLGRALTSGERVLVRWTVDAGDADAHVLGRHGKAALRQHRLQRLLDEAAAQGASPTDDDLAAALGVSRRTILRDLARLTHHGVALATRRRRPP
jgi:DNA-binding SARP family transcriptional activator